MYKAIFLLFSGCFFFFLLEKSHAQCTPDASCSTVSNPRMVCPGILQEGIEGTTYNEVLTFNSPAKIKDPDNGKEMQVYKMVIKNIGNLPVGLSYEVNTTELLPGIPACAMITGIAAQEGFYKLKLIITPYVYSMGVPVQYPDLVDSSLFIIIHKNNQINELIPFGFLLLEANPNPFSGATRIGCLSSSSCTVDLKIFDILGKMTYRETLHAVSGKNYFRFNGDEIHQGLYFYTVATEKQALTRQLIKK